MKITNVECFIVDAGWRPWVFVKVETDKGITGYGECSVSRAPFAFSWVWTQEPTR
ncbi:MAG: Mandelate racemase/muconate lactonizing protein [Deltaproteobacteria bacterium]|nr:Mandelate racemase/muconate lactonizing protein [Deltaproteobacteria bacterium]